MVAMKMLSFSLIVTKTEILDNEDVTVTTLKSKEEVSRFYSKRM